MVGGMRCLRKTRPGYEEADPTTHLCWSMDRVIGMIVRLRGRILGHGSHTVRMMDMVTTGSCCRQLRRARGDVSRQNDVTTQEASVRPCMV
jgi:hypothetical protein